MYWIPIGKCFAIRLNINGNVLWQNILSICSKGIILYICTSREIKRFVLIYANKNRCCSTSLFSPLTFNLCLMCIFSCRAFQFVSDRIFILDLCKFRWFKCAYFKVDSNFDSWLSAEQCPTNQLLTSIAETLWILLRTKQKLSMGACCEKWQQPNLIFVGLCKLA